MGETRGYPDLSKVAPQAANVAVAVRLWEVSERLAGVSFRLEPAMA